MTAFAFRRSKRHLGSQLSLPTTERDIHPIPASTSVLKDFVNTFFSPLGLWDVGERRQD